MSNDIEIAETLGVPDREREEVREILRAYRQHREDYPLPSDWTDDTVRIEPYAKGDPEGYAELVFTREGWNDDAFIEVDLTCPGSASVFVADRSGKGFGKEELSDLIYELLGVRAQVVPSDDPEAQFDPRAEYDPKDKTWRSYFHLSPYPAAAGVTKLIQEDV